MTLQEAASPLPLVDEHGRYSRASIMQRAQQIHRAGLMEWAAARSKAYREASEELRARFNRVSTVPAIAIRKQGAHV